MNYKTSKKGQRGQALILIAFAAIGLFAFSALAIDGSRAFSNKRHAQNAADTSALTAALKYIRTSGTDAAKYTAAVDAAKARAKDNGFDPANPGASYKLEVQVYVQRCSETTDLQTGQPLVCDGLPAGITTAQKAEFIRVRIVSTIPTTFGRVIGRQSLTSAAEAIARVQGGGTSSSSWPFTGAGMVAVKNGNVDKCLMMNGGGNLYMHGSGIIINCTHTQAWWMDGNATLVMDGQGKVGGCFYENGSVNGGPFNTKIDCRQPSHTYTADDFASIPTTVPPPTCSGAGTVDSGDTRDYTYGGGSSPSLTVKKGTVVINPGNWGTIMVETSGDLKMKPGPYCLNGGLTVKAGSALGNQGTGPVKIVLGDNSFLVNGSAGGGSSVNFADLELYFKDGSYQQNSDKVSFNASRLRIFTTGTGSVDVNAGGSFTSYDAYIYLYRGDIIWNADTTLHLEASTSGDFAGLLVYKPWGNTDQTTFNGGSNVYLEGTFLAPTTQVTYNGGSDWELHSQIIADSFLVNGNADVDIYYVESENYKPPSAPASTIELTK